MLVTHVKVSSGAILELERITRSPYDVGVLRATLVMMPTPITIETHNRTQLAGENAKEFLRRANGNERLRNRGGALHTAELPDFSVPLLGPVPAHHYIRRCQCKTANSVKV